MQQTNDQEGDATNGKDVACKTRFLIKYTLLTGEDSAREIESYLRFELASYYSPPPFLFPPALTAHLTPCPPDFPMLALWGQFLDHQGYLHDDLASLFMERIQGPRTLEDLAHAFPYAVLMASAEIEAFYAFYRIRS